MADNMGLIASGFSSDVYDILDGTGVGSDPTGHLDIDADDFAQFQRCRADEIEAVNPECKRTLY